VHDRGAEKIAKIAGIAKSPKLKIQFSPRRREGAETERPWILCREDRAEIAEIGNLFTMEGRRGGSRDRNTQNLTTD